MEFVQNLAHAPGNLRHIHQVFRYARDLLEYLRQGGQLSAIVPILSDYAARSGEASGHYFHQDLLVAQFIHADAPSRHIDIGSRVDGFVAHVATMRPIEVLDIRPQPKSSHANIRFRQADLTRPPADLIGACPSVSSLHALEHFGLGRYSDSISARGHLDGFAAIAALVAPAGRLYLSVPVGRERTLFNSHRIFAPDQVPQWAGDFQLERFDFVDDAGAIHFDQPTAAAAALRYGCGIYTLRKN